MGKVLLKSKNFEYLRSEKQFLKLNNMNRITIPLISVFNPGYVNRKNGRTVMQCHPYKEASLTEIYDYIRGPKAQSQTAALRAEPNEKKQSLMKLETLKYCTPFGTFSYRNEKGLLSRSGMMVTDIDDVADPVTLASLREALKGDPRYVTELLFTSPRGHGLKWFIRVGDMDGMALKDYFRRVSRYIQFEYGIVIDESGKDVARACYLSHDPDCYINPEYIISIA